MLYTELGYFAFQGGGGGGGRDIGMDVGSISQSSANWSLVPVLEPPIVQVSRSLCSLGLRTTD